MAGVLVVQTYYTVRIPYVMPALATEWHPTTAQGPFATLDRGAFPSELEAIVWAKKHLKGTPYSVVRIEH